MPPGDPPPGELPVEDDAADESPAVAAPSPTATVRVVGGSPLPWCGRSGSCWPTPSESRTTGRGVGRPAGFAGLDVEALADSPWVGLVECSEALAAVDVAWWVSFAVCVDVAGSVSVTFVVDVAVSVDICGVPVAVPVDVTCSVWVGLSVNTPIGVLDRGDLDTH